MAYSSGGADVARLGTFADFRPAYVEFAELAGDVVELAALADESWIRLRDMPYLLTISPNHRLRWQSLGGVGLRRCLNRRSI